MARFNGAIYGLIVLALSQYAAPQTVHVVGDNQGWTVGGPNLYLTWASGKTFSVGDILTFNFVYNEHDVLRVPTASFDACSESNGIGDIITNGPINITLEAAGEHYYIRTVGRHCAAGQKLAITVSGASSPTATPAPTAPSPIGNSPAADCAPTAGPASSPPPLPASSSSKVLATVLLSFGATMMVLMF